MAASNVPSIPSYGEFRRFVGLQTWLVQITRPRPNQTSPWRTLQRFQLFTGSLQSCLKLVYFRTSTMLSMDAMPMSNKLLI